MAAVFGEMMMAAVFGEDDDGCCAGGMELRAMCVGETAQSLGYY